MASILIPLGLAILMAAVGLETRPSDFRALLGAPRAVAVGLVVQLGVLPLLAAVIATLLALPGPLAVGLVLVAAAPGGVTANYATLLARGDPATAVTLTVATSLVAPITVPLWVGAAFARFTDESVVVAMPFGPTLAALFAVTVVPLAIGSAIAHRRPNLIVRAGPWIRRVSTVVFVVIVTAAIAAQGSALATHGLEVGPAALAFDLVATAIVIAVASATRIDAARAAALVQTTVLRNVAVALTVAIVLLGRPEVAAAATVYVVVMNAVALGHVAWRRSRLSEVKAAGREAV